MKVKLFRHWPEIFLTALVLWFAAFWLLTGLFSAGGAIASVLVLGIIMLMHDTVWRCPGCGNRLSFEGLMSHHQCGGCGAILLVK